LATLDTAIRYAREQEIIQGELSAEKIFADFEKYVGEA
jgi:4,5-dihydroxyphthalate decarboxylase